MTILEKLFVLGTILVTACLGSYLYGMHRITVKWEKDKTAWQVTYNAQVAETNRIQGEWDKVKVNANDWKIKAETAGNDAAAVARRLRQRPTCGGTLPQAPGGTGDSDPTSGESDDLGRLEESHFAACARDSERLGMWQVFYSELRQAR